MLEKFDRRLRHSDCASVMDESRRLPIDEAVNENDTGRTSASEPPGGSAGGCGGTDGGGIGGGVAGGAGSCGG